MRFLRLICQGSFNSFRQPEFHTYHKTLPLPPKTTVAGMIGSALGISPRQVNDEWLLNERFKMGIIGSSNGKANDLWQIRKYESKHIKAYQTGKEPTPYKTSVIVREILYDSRFILYLAFEDTEDYETINLALKNPKWALSLGREDELIKVQEIDILELYPEKVQYPYSQTIIPGDIAEIKYSIHFDQNISGNLLDIAPKTVSLPVSFTINTDTEVRYGTDYRKFTFIGNLPITLEEDGFFDNELKNSFQIF